MTMTRRDFLSAAAALAATPALGARAWAAPLPREADIVVIGAGAAGIAAARRIIAANRKGIVVEATGQIGGRGLTDTTRFEGPFDRRRRRDRGIFGRPGARQPRHRRGLARQG